MKKFLVIASALLMLTVIFAACNGDHTPAVTEGNTSAGTDPVTEMSTQPAEKTEAPTEMPTEAPTEAPTQAMTLPVESETYGAPAAETLVETMAATEAPTEVFTEELTEAATETLTVKTFTVSFYISGAFVPSQPEPQTVEEGGYITVLSVNRPEDGSSFDGWYTSPTCEADSKFDFSTPITKDMTLYGWLSGPMTEPVDPNEPTYYIEPEFIDYNAKNDGANYKKEMGSAEMMTEGDRTFVRLFPDMKGIGDGYVTVIDVGSYTQVANYMAISYRTNGHLNGQMYMGTGERWNGQGDEISLEWIKDDEWHLLIIDLDNSVLTSVEDYVLNYCRLDMFENKTEPHEYLDVEYIAFFDAYEKAEAYDAERHHTSD
ncbi:MAG: hypothetical protein E7661_09130 [Ruminococcaceae bacterium]|nr:hypothetical protein [Oscillospiraceae bacterium]